MRARSSSEKLAIAASQQINERDYWLKQLAGELMKSSFPYDYKKNISRSGYQHVAFGITQKIASRLQWLSSGSDYTLHVYLVAAIVLLLEKYTSNRHIIVGAPIYKQKIEGEFTNTMLALNHQLNHHMTCKELIIHAVEIIKGAIGNKSYPIEILIQQLHIANPGEGFPLFDVVVLLENIHDMEYIQNVNPNMVFSFIREDESIKGIVKYNPSYYNEGTIKQIIKHLENLLVRVLFNLDIKISSVDILSGDERNRLLFHFNQTSTAYPRDKGIHQLFAEQVEMTPNQVAVVFEDKHLSYGRLAEKSGQLAYQLTKRGVKADSMVGLMVERSLEMVIGILGILKAGGGYLPLDPDMPGNRLFSMWEDSQVSILLTTTAIIEKFQFTSLQNLDQLSLVPHLTPYRPQITELDRLPIPDRSLVNYEKYNQYIGLAAVKDCMTLQATRGCPYKCAYCHKIWPKTHVKRSAKHIFSEVQNLYNLGIKRFSLIDDIFNLDRKNSGRFFEMVIENGLDLQIFFPSGVRADILDKDYIDLMVKAGTVSIGLALETASPRLQKLIGKNLDVEKLRENALYIIEKYPQVILELFTMHGFPTETEEEALMTLEFIKSMKWLHFPYVFTLRIYPNTDMEALAMKNGISRQSIIQSSHGGFHQLPDTLPFDKQFTLKYQSKFLNEYFLSKERLLKMLPHQMKLLTADEIVQKYNAYLPEEINCIADLLNLVGIKGEELGNVEFLADDHFFVPHLDEKLTHHFPRQQPGENALKVIILDLSTFFSQQVDVFYDMIEPPLGPLYLLTYLNQQLGPRINGRIVKSRMDFDNYDQLKKLLEDFKPDVIGVRSLTYYKNFFHQTIAMIRQWGITVPIIAGGPYATSDYTSILQDCGIDLVVRGEGEITFCEIIGKIIENNGTLPDEAVLKSIPGIAFIPKSARVTHPGGGAREIIMLDQQTGSFSRELQDNSLPGSCSSADFAYCMFTSGTTGIPKGTLISHNNVTRLVKNSNYIDLTPHDRILQLSNYAFDGSVFDIFGALLNGAVLVMIKKEDVFSIDKLAQLIKKQGITVFFVTTALFNTLVDLEIHCLKHVKKVLFGGERVSVEHAKKAREYLGKNRILHMYGPTETTVYSTFHNIDAIDEFFATIPIGKPLANTTVYILDNQMKPVPMGAGGELYIGGNGVARGYLNRVELTKETFIPNPFVRGERLYRTGDTGRWLANGTIEFLDRIDSQVKIRGFRIEPGEIESRLLNHPGIKEAVVLANENLQGQRFLCAFIVHANENERDYPLDPWQLKQYLSNDLPDYMIPLYFIPLDSIPLTANGKIDRRALPDPLAGERKNYTAPRDLLETKLVKIWEEVLGVKKDHIGIDADFFDLGGHSLKVTELLSLIHKELKVIVPLQEVFVRSTLRELAAFIKEAAQEKYTPINPVEQKTYYNLSSAQKRLFILQQMEDKNISYNIPHAFVLEGQLNQVKLEETFNRLIQRHDSFRTSFDIVNEEPFQRVHKENGRFQITHYQPAHNSPNQIKQTIKTFIQPFDLSRAPLLRVGLIKTGEEMHILMVDIHHIIADAHSFGIFINDFMAMYTGKPLTQLNVQYKDFSEWQNRRKALDVIKKQEQYWFAELKGEIPVLNLPTDYKRPTTSTFEGRTLHFEMGKQETAALNKMALESDSTLFILLLTIYNIFLSRLSGQEDIIIGTPIANRNHPDLQQGIGMLVNTIALRNNPAGEKVFRKFLEEVTRRTLKAFENQDYQFEDLVEHLSVKREPNRNPIFDVMLVVLNSGILPTIEIPGLKLKPYELENVTSKFDLNWRVEETGEKLIFTVEYSTRLFKQETIETFIGYFKKIISTVTANPGVKLVDIEILDSQEKEKLLQMSIGTPGVIDPGETIHRWFEKTASRVMEKVALVHNRQQLTYGELNNRANRLAAGLRDRGVGPGSIVGIMVQRSLEMVISLLAVMKAGAAYLPVDPEYPAERQRYMLQNSGVQLVLTNLPGKNEQSGKIDIPENIEIIDINNKTIYCGHGENPVLLNSGEDLVYVIYTSGSTGIPKGVMLEHRNLVNLLSYQFEFTNLDCSRVLQFSTISFDASFQEIFSALLSGGQLCLVDEGERVDVLGLFNIIEQNDIKTLFLPISYLKILFTEEEYASCFPRCVLHIQSAGEQVVISQRFRDYLKENHTYLHNHYGPAETHVVTTLTLTPSGEIPEFPSIGKPILNTSIYILDKEKRLQPTGVPGEIFIGGIQVGRGYLGSPDMTAERFIPGPFPGDQRLYRTGDLAHWLADGNLVFLGRVDQQVKIRGFRVEIGEIESRLRQVPYIKETVVIDRTDEKGDKYLCAYIAAEQEIKGPELRRILARELPSYMIPAYFIGLKEIPVKSNGKVDRNTLPEPEPGQSAGDYAAPANEIERKLTDIWAGILALDPEKIDVHNGFFELGGHSLKATILSLKIQKEFQVKISLPEIFKRQTIKELGVYIEDNTKEPFVPLEPAEEKEYYPMSSAQRRLYFLQQMNLNSSAYNLEYAYTLEGKLQYHQLEKTFHRLIQRHDALRTSFLLAEGKPVQRIHPGVDFEIRYFTATPQETGKIIDDFLKPFDLSRAPAMQTALVKLESTKHILLFDIHHIIMDGISMETLVKEFMEIYSGRDLSLLKIQYKDFCQWHHSEKKREEKESHESFWLKEFGSNVPLLRLPLDYPRPLEQSYKGELTHFTLTPQETLVLKQIAQTENTTLFTVLLALYYVLLSQLSGQEDIVVGTVTAGRIHADLQDTVGLFVNTLALRNYPTGSKTFRKFLIDVHQRNLKAFENQDYQFEELVEQVVQQREIGRNPLFDAAFGMQDIQIPNLKIPGVTLTPVQPKDNISKFDITWYGIESGDQLQFTVTYRTELFKLTTIQRFIDYFREIVSTVTNHPDIRLEDIAISHDFFDQEIAIPDQEESDFGFE